PPATPRGADPEADHAVALMARSILALREYREAVGPPLDSFSDINRTGLIGVENSPITTSLGRLEAKRTATNPLFAGAVVRMFREAGVRRGDYAAIGASSSFPGLILATLCAAEALGLKPLLISSLGASNWGGNHPDWTWLEMSACLRQKGILDVAPVALSIGGEKDSGLDMSEDGRRLLWRKIVRTGLPFIREPDLAKNVAVRAALLEKSAGGRPIKVFVNVGGSFADMGTDGEVLKLQPGYNPASAVHVPPWERRGLIQEMARRGIPVIHLLFIKGLCDRYGLPWDPVPLPEPSQNRGSTESGPLRQVDLIALGVYLAGMIFGFGWIIRNNRRFGI
ncbi:MAG: poly-gamma-glutamate system protein, partial [Candidatus Aminicenantes bacterium]|nr:poly-gamma-glutamate system protein [Candidatus Aminicenantes bacterium]